MQVVSKYMACTAFDTETEECTALVWVDPPAGGIPPLTAEEGAALGGVTLCVWCGVIAMVLIRKGASK